MSATLSPAPTPVRRTLSPPLAYGARHLRDRARPVRVDHPVAAVRHLSRAVGLLAARAHARLRRRTRSACCTTLILAGRISDDVGPAARPARRARHADGRRRCVFMVADSVVWLFVGARAAGPRHRARARRRERGDARPASAARPGRRRARERRGRAPAGSASGMLASSAIVELLPAPRVLPYVLLLVLFAVAFAGALLMPEPVAERARPRLTPQRPSVPAPGAPRLPAGGARGDLVVVDRRAVLLARPRAVGRAVPLDRPPRGRRRRVRARRARRRSRSSRSGARRRGPARSAARSRSRSGCS